MGVIDNRNVNIMHIMLKMFFLLAFYVLLTKHNGHF